MVKLNDKTANRLAKLFVEFYEGNRTKQQLWRLDQAILEIQQTWIGTH